MRFHNCNARVFIVEDSNRYKVIQFVSYQTAVCRVWFDAKTNKLERVCFGRFSKFSPTTTRQVSRFLREYIEDETELQFAVASFKAFNPDKGKIAVCTRDLTTYEEPFIKWDGFGRVE